VGFEVAREQLRLGEKSGLPTWLVSRLWFVASDAFNRRFGESPQTHPDSQGQFTITLGNYAKRNTR